MSTVLRFGHRYSLAHALLVGALLLPGGACLAGAPGGSPATTLPGDLFRRDEHAIIIVGGRPTPVGAVRQDLARELERRSGPASIMRRTRPHLAPPSGVATAHRPDVVIPRGAQATAPTARIGSALRPPVPTGIGVSRYSARTEPDPCPRSPPGVESVRGRIEAGQAFTLDGHCFGAESGSLEMIGEFPGGRLVVPFTSWRNATIDASTPAVRGVTDHTVAVTVVRADGQRSPAIQAEFIAARERIELPGRFWQPQSSLDATDFTAADRSLFGPSLAIGSTPAEHTSNWSIEVNPQCALDSMVSRASAGRIVAVTGFEDGPANAATIAVRWVPVCTTTTDNYIVAESSHQVCHVRIDLAAWAYCPSGWTP